MPFFCFIWSLFGEGVFPLGFGVFLVFVWGFVVVVWHFGFCFCFGLFFIMI